MPMKQLLLIAFLSLLLPTAHANMSCLGQALNDSASQFQPHLITLSSPSGGGKTTLATLLVKKFPNLVLSVSSTTRAPRGQEKDGVDYHFLTREEFQEKIKRGEFAEWAEVHGNYYGTDMSLIRGQMAQGNSVLILPDIKGADALRDRFPNETYTIFIQPPNMKVLEERLRSRGTDSEETIQLRLANAREEMAAAKRFHRTIINDDLNRAFQEISGVVAPLIPQTSVK